MFIHRLQIADQGRTIRISCSYETRPPHIALYRLLLTLDVFMPEATNGANCFSAAFSWAPTARVDGFSWYGDSIRRAMNIRKSSRKPKTYFRPASTIQQTHADMDCGDSLAITLFNIR